MRGIEPDSAIGKPLIDDSSGETGRCDHALGTGFGPTNPAVPAGQEPTVAAPPTQNPVTVTLGGTPVPVLGAVLSSYAAVYQIAIQIPPSMPDGD